MRNTALHTANPADTRASRCIGSLSEDVARLEAMVDLLAGEASPRSRRALATFHAALADRRRELLNAWRQDTPA